MVEEVGKPVVGRVGWARSRAVVGSVGRMDLVVGVAGCIEGVVAVEGEGQAAGTGSVVVGRILVAVVAVEEAVRFVG